MLKNNLLWLNKSQFEEKTLLDHPKFGLGIVESVSANKIVVLFEDQASRLHLDPMVARNDAPMSTAFTVSIDYKHGRNLVIKVR